MGNKESTVDTGDTDSSLHKTVARVARYAASDYCKSTNIPRIFILIFLGIFGLKISCGRSFVLQVTFQCDSLYRQQQHMLKL